MEEKRDLKNTPKVLGLDISTKTIGWSLFDIKTQELLELTHFSPVIKPKPEDIQFVTKPVLNHRLILTPEAEMEGLSTENVIDEILQTIEVPR